MDPVLGAEGVAGIGGLDPPGDFDHRCVEVHEPPAFFLCRLFLGRDDLPDRIVLAGQVASLDSGRLVERRAADHHDGGAGGK